MRYICTSKPIGLAQSFSTGNMFSAVKLLYGSALELDASHRPADRISDQVFALFYWKNNDVIEWNSVGREARPIPPAVRGTVSSVRRQDGPVECATFSTL
jgi:hypothetical protein